MSQFGSKRAVKQCPQRRQLSPKAAMAAPFPISRRTLPEQGEAGRPTPRWRPDSPPLSADQRGCHGPWRRGAQRACPAPPSQPELAAAEAGSFRPPGCRGILAGMSTRPRSQAGPPMTLTPNPGSWFAHQHDEYGTGVEVYPAGTELRPAGPEGAGAMTEPMPNPFRARRPDLSGTDHSDRRARRLAVPLLRARRRRLPRDGSLDREYRHGRVADAGLRHRISDADPPARGARGLTRLAVV